MSRRKMTRRRPVKAATLLLALAALLAGVFAGASITQAAVTLPALAGHWPMLEGSGGTIADTSPSGNTAYPGAGATWTTGPGGAPAIALNGTSAGIVPIFKPVVNTSASFTVSAWVKFNNTNGNQTFVSMDGTKLSGFFLQINGTPGKFAFIRHISDSTSSAAAAALSSVTPTVGTWYHVVGEDNTATGQLQLYVNGTEAATAAYTANWQASGNTLIGRGYWNSAPSDFVNGAVSDVQMYQAALSTAQVDALNGTPVATAAASAGSGSGSATVSDSNPVAACTKAMKCLTYVGDPLTITATAGSASRLTGWSGGTCSGVASPCSFTSAKTETDTASFVKTVTITAATSGSGTATITDSDALANCTKVTTCIADAGDSVTVTATPTPGFVLTGWSGGSCAGTRSTCVLSNVSANTTVSVQFGLPLAGTAAQAVFVSPTGSDANPGTESAPVLTPQHALLLVEASGRSKDQLRLAQGSYGGGLSLTSADDGVAIYGGFVASSWASSNSPATATTISGAPAAVLADHATGVLIQQVDLLGQVAAGVSPSVYGVRAIDGSQLTLSDVAVAAANASPGLAGTLGPDGAAGGAGGRGAAGQSAAQVVAACLASDGSSCRATEVAGGVAGRGANGNDYSLRGNGTYKRNPLLLARSKTLPDPQPGPSAGDGGFGGWGSTASPSALQGCIGKGVFAACGPEQISSKTRKPQVIALWYGSLGSTPSGGSGLALEGRGGADGYYNAGGDGYPGKGGSPGSRGAAGGGGANGANPVSPGDAWAPGSGSTGSTGSPGAGGGGGGGGGFGPPGN